MSSHGPLRTDGTRLVVFVGTILRETIQDAVAYPWIDFRPPASRDDLLALIRHARTGSNTVPITVGIVDGTKSGPSLPPKEVMQAISAGAQLFGAVGDGALRAAECASYGMTGVGRIYRHAVGQLVSPLDEYWAPVPSGSEDQSLVAWRVALEDAVAGGTVDEGDARAFLDAAEQVPWRQRTLAQVVAQAQHADGRAEVRRVAASLRLEQHHVMRQDATAMVTAMVAAAGRSTSSDE